MKNLFPDVPLLGLTATATSRVITDVQKILNIQGCLVLKSSFNRSNLFYEVGNSNDLEIMYTKHTQRLCKIIKPF